MCEQLPIPNVTMVFLAVESAKAFSIYNRKEARHVNEITVACMINTLRQVGGSPCMHVWMYH